ncbi:MAG: thymidylate synthase, partial [Paracoccaceae bacterium]
VTYTGEYAGLTNLNFPRSGSTDILPLPAGITDDNPIAPQQPDMVVGTVFINADFTDSVINGSIVDRSLVGRGTAQPDINLDPATITADGTFLGTVTRSMDQQNIGTYGGAFGGTQATGVAGAVEIADYLDDIDNEQEYGAFVLTRCGQPGEGALCASVDP